MTHFFPKTMDYLELNEPIRMECDIYDLIIEGEIPSEISGSWFRVSPDPQYPPLLGNDINISGDGMIGLFQFEDGHVDFKMRYIMSERLKNDRSSRRSLYGSYRNPYTDDTSVQGKSRAVYNTTPIYHGGKLLALKEDYLGMELDPVTLETLGEWNYNGLIKSETMTAHPRLDPDTGELYFFGFEADGLATTDVSYCVADKNGKLISEQWFKAPYCSHMHDFAITDKHAIFPVFPTVCKLETLKNGGSHWAWDPTLNTHIGIMPRNGDVKDMRWFEGPPCYSFHMMNAFTEGDLVHMDLCVADVSMFPSIQEAGNVNISPKDANSRLARFTFNMASDDTGWVETVLGPDSEMPRVAEKDMLKDYSIGYFLRYLPENGAPIMSGPIGMGFNTLCRIEIKTGELKSFAIPGTTLQEPVHIKSKQKGHEGYLAMINDIPEQRRADILLFEAENIDKGPIATIHLPIMLRTGVHGNWVPKEEF